MWRILAPGYFPRTAMLGRISGPMCTYLRRTLPLLTILLAFGCASAPPIHEQLIKLEDMAGQLATNDVVFLGEVHANAECQQLQFETIKKLHEARPELVLSMEMVERDAQSILDRWLAGNATDAEFIEEARARFFWKTYEPILRYAKENKILVIAANVPRSLAARIAKEGLAKVKGETYMPRETTAPRNDYWVAFVHAMNSAHGAVTENPDGLYRYYVAQCVKDDAMAESIADHVLGRRAVDMKSFVVHLCGSMHSDHGRGTVSRLRARVPGLRIGSASAKSHEGAIFAGGDIADFLWMVRKSKKRAVGKPTSKPTSKPAKEEIDIEPDAKPGMGFMPAYGGENEGCGVEMVMPDRPAAKAGIKGGDVIVEIDGEDIDSVETYSEVLNEKRVGQVVSVIVLRDGKRKELKVKLGRSGR